MQKNKIYQERATNGITNCRRKWSKRNYYYYLKKLCLCVWLFRSRCLFITKSRNLIRANSYRVTLSAPPVAQLHFFSRRVCPFWCLFTRRLPLPSHLACTCWSKTKKKKNKGQNRTVNGYRGRPSDGSTVGVPDSTYAYVCKCEINKPKSLRVEGKYIISAETGRLSHFQVGEIASPEGRNQEKALSLALHNL